MITGKVTDGEARIPWRVRGSRRSERKVEAIIDTGYTASMTLPPRLISELGLRWRSLERGTSARLAWESSPVAPKPPSSSADLPPFFAHELPFNEQENRH
jgi:hypothetical protein